jgi:YjbE family integral membrane protein
VFSLGKIIWVDVLLSGDNAIVIAAVCAGFPHRQRLMALGFGTVLAILLRIVLTGSATYLMTLTGLRICGGLALLYIATKLLVPDDGGANAHPARTFLSAIIAIGIADISMSIDNIVAVAAIANGNIILLSIGLIFSITLIMCAAGIITQVIDRLPILMYGGAALLGWIAGELIASDPLINTAPEIYGATGVVLVLAVGFFWRNFVMGQWGQTGETDG